MPKNWYVNCMPGGTFLDIAVEMDAAAKCIAFAPSCVVLAVGTNNAGRHMVMQRAKKHFRLMVANAASLFPTAKVREFCRL